MVTLDDVLTAGHCIRGDLTDLGVFTETESFTIGNGGIVNLDRHPGYTELNDGSVVNDVAMVTVSRAVDISPVPIVVSRQIAVGERFSAYGFGTDETGRSGIERSSDDILKAGFMQVTAVVPLAFAANYDLTGSSVCPGDSGGPAIIEVNGVSAIAGVTSFGSISGCQAGSGAAFVNLSEPGISAFILNYAGDVSSI
jgi:secreted trypsin-like serine protease